MQHPQSRKLSPCFLIQLDVIMKWTSAALYRYEIKQAAIQTSCLLSFWSVVMVVSNIYQNEFGELILFLLWVQIILLSG